MIFLVIPPNVVSESQYCWLSLLIVTDHCVLYFYPQHFMFPWTFQGEAWLWVCWKDFSWESPSWIVAEWGLPISLQNMPPQSFPSLAQCIELLDPLMLWDENLRLYLWLIWKWERYVSYCGTGKNLIRVTYFGPPCIFILSDAKFVICIILVPNHVNVG